MRKPIEIEGVFGVLWIGAVANTSFVCHGEAAVQRPDQIGSNCFQEGNSLVVGLANDGAYTSLLFNCQTGFCRPLPFACPEASALSYDASSETLWAYQAKTKTVSSFSSLAGQVKPSPERASQDSLTRLMAPESCLLFPSTAPPNAASTLTPFQTGALMLNNLVTLGLDQIGDNPTSAVASVKRTVKKEPEDFECVKRFTACGGGWGYGASCVDAVAFTVSSEVCACVCVCVCVE